MTSISISIRVLVSVSVLVLVLVLVFVLVVVVVVVVVVLVVAAVEAVTVLLLLLLLSSCYFFDDNDDYYYQSRVYGSSLWCVKHLENLPSLLPCCLLASLFHCTAPFLPSCRRTACPPCCTAFPSLAILFCPIFPTVPGRLASPPFMYLLFLLFTLVLYLLVSRARPVPDIEKPTHSVSPRLCHVAARSFQQPLIVVLPHHRCQTSSAYGLLTGPWVPTGNQ